MPNTAGLSNIVCNIDSEVAGCEFTGLTLTGTDGAAFSLGANSDVTIRNCRFCGCGCGGSILCGGIVSAGRVDIEGCNFLCNMGAIWLTGASTSVTNLIVDSVFEDNFTSLAAIMVASSATPVEITRSAFRRNTGYTRGLNSNGAAVLTQYGTASSVTIRDCSFAGNRVRQTAAGLGCGALMKLLAGTTVIERSLFDGNTLLQTNTITEAASNLHTPGIYSANTLLARDCVFSGNTCIGNSSAKAVNFWASALIRGAGGAATFLNCAFFGNAVTNNSVTGDQQAYNEVATIKITRAQNGGDTSFGTAFANCVLAGNDISTTCTNTAEVLLDTKLAERYGYTLSFLNTIISHNGGRSLLTGEITPSISHCAIADWTDGPLTNGYDYIEAVSAAAPLLASPRKGSGLSFSQLGVSAQSPFTKTGIPVYAHGTDLYFYAPGMVAGKPWRKCALKSSCYANFAGDASLVPPAPEADSFGAARVEGKIAYGPLNASPLGFYISIR